MATNMSTESNEEQFVNLPVPANRVQEVYALLAKPAAPAPRADVGKDNDVGWTAALLKRMYLESAEQMRQMLKILAKAEGEEVSTNEIASALDLPKGARSVAGMAGAIGRRVNSRYGMEGLPWETRWRYIDPTNESAGTETLIRLPKWACDVINDI